MGYEYDSKVNRDLARTAMSIYTKAHNIKPEPINESKEVINEEALRENINSLILNYVSDVIVLAEQELGREMTDVEINEASMELLDRINSISDEEKTAFVTQLAEEAGMAAAEKGDAVSAGRPNVGVEAGAGSDGGAVGAFDPANYTLDPDSIAQLFRDFADQNPGALLTQLLNFYADQGGGTRTGGIAAAPTRRRG